MREINDQILESIYNVMVKITKYIRACNEKSGEWHINDIRMRQKSTLMSYPTSFSSPKKVVALSNLCKMCKIFV